MPWHLSLPTAAGSDRIRDSVSRLLALDCQYLLNRLTAKEYQTQVTDILAQLER